MLRRSYSIRLDANAERPWERTGFAIKGLSRYIATNRGTLLANAAAELMNPGYESSSRLGIPFCSLIWLTSRTRFANFASGLFAAKANGGERGRHSNSDMIRWALPPNKSPLTFTSIRQLQRVQLLAS